MRNILILLFLILFLGLTAALDCQYQTTQPYEKQVQVLYSNEDNQVLNPQVSYDDFQSVGFGNLEKTFKIFNKSDFEKGKSFADWLATGRASSDNYNPLMFQCLFEK